LANANDPENQVLADEAGMGCSPLRLALHSLKFLTSMESLLGSLYVSRVLSCAELAQLKHIPSGLNI